MQQRYPCESCFVSLSDNQQFCPNCGKKNPYYNPDAKRSKAKERILNRAKGLHHPSATIGTCAYCDSAVWSDEKICSGCGAPNPNFVVHPDSNVSRSGAEKEHGRENASTSKCPYCNATVRSNERVCPNCGSENPNYIEDTARVIINPRTIEELKEYCAERDMPLLRMRFFIGEDFRGPRAFGIYKDGTGRVIVYKNKNDGSRAIRYSGTDERYAVREIYQKLLEECRKRGINPDQSLNAAYQNNGYRPANNPSQSSYSNTSSSPRKTPGAVFRTVVLAFVLLVIFSLLSQCMNYVLISGLSDCDGSSYSGYDSGSSSSWSSWDSDSGSSSWDSWDSDSGSSSWDSWDSGGSDWDSDW